MEQSKSFQSLKKKFPIRTRAHVNPLSDEDYDHPSDPSQVNLDTMFPKREKGQEITILDVGCAYAGYLITISPLVESNLCLGIEIRRKVKKNSLLTNL
jgi:tRNA (guanine-N7-)-methyltransferase